MHRALRILAFLLAFPVFAATPPQSVDLDLSQTARAFRLQFAEGTTPLLRASVKNAGTAYTVTGWTATLYLSATWDDTSVIAIPSTTTGATYFDFQMTGTQTSTNGVFTANIIATDGTATVEWQRGEVEIRPSPGSAGAGTITMSTPLSWSGYTYSNTGSGGPYRAGSNVVFTINGDGSANINATDSDTLGDLTPTAGRLIYGTGTAWVTLAAGATGQVLTAQGAAAPSWSSAGAGDVTGLASADGSIVVTSGGGPVPDVALPATLPARNGSLLTAINAATLGGVLPAGYATTNSVANAIANAHAAATVTGGLLTLSGQQIGLSTNSVRSAVSGIYLPLIGGNLTGDIELANLAGYSAAVGFRDGFNNLLQLRVNASGVLQFDGATVWNSANDGAGSAMDADTLDGETGADYHDPDNLTGGTVPDAVTAAKYRQPVITWTYRDLTWNTTAGAGWTGYEIETGSSGSKRTFGLDAISASATTDQTGTFKSDWIPVPANFAAFKTTGAIKVTWVSSQAVVGESELRGIRLIGSSDLTGANATDLYADATARDITTTGVPVAVTINRSAFASTTVPAYLCVQIDASVEDGDKLAIISVEVLSE